MATTTPSFYGGVNAWHGSEQFWCEGENACISARGSDKSASNSAEGSLSHSAGCTPRLIRQKWSFKMNAQHFRARFVGFMLGGDIFGDAFAAAANIVRTGGYGGGDKRSGAVTSEGSGDNAQRFRVPSITSRPPAPWMCTSTNPGMADLSVAEISAASSGRLIPSRGPISSMTPSRMRMPASGFRLWASARVWRGSKWWTWQQYIVTEIASHKTHGTPISVDTVNTIARERAVRRFTS